MNPTEEQKAIVNAAVAGKSLRVDAISGSGKTTSSVMVAEAVKKPVLYLAYNKALSVEGAKKFGNSAVVRTTHSLAYRGLDISNSKYMSKLSAANDRKTEYGVTFTDMVRLYEPDPIGSFFDRYDMVKLARNAVNRFQFSGDIEIDESHCYDKENSKSTCAAKIKPSFQQLWRESDATYEGRLLKEAGELAKSTIKPVLEIAQRMWKNKIDIGSLCKIDHDTYLKMFQLSLAGVSGPWRDLGGRKSGYGLVILDEAQDTNSCVLAIVQMMNIQTIAVGDARQALYKFRGAENAMDKLDYPSLRLSQSWRFGSEVAKLATDILKSDGYEFEIKGNPSVETKIGEFNDGPTTFLSRTNAGVIEDALSYIDRGEVVSIEIDAARVGRMITDCVHIKEGDFSKVKTPELKPYSKHWEVLKELSESDIDLKKVVKIADDKTRDDALEIGETLSNYRRPRAAKYTFCTGHKSKGLEWDNVKLNDDFPSQEMQDQRAFSTEEINLLYVSCTRPMKRLQVNSAAQFFIDGKK